LRNEFTGFNIKVSVAYPPDTDTAGFAEENKTKPVETVEMLMPSVHSPATVATYIWYSVKKGDFNCSCPDILQDFLIALMSGVTPRRLYIFDVLIHPIVIMIASIFRWNSDRIACKYPKRLHNQRS
jgi:3-dehydrosphinganine reductase